MSNAGAKAARRAAQKPPNALTRNTYYLCRPCGQPSESKTARCSLCGAPGGWVPLEPTTMSLSDLREWARDMNANSDRVAAMKTHWIAGLLLYAKKVSDDQNPCSDEDVVMFWLRLYGAIAEFPAELEGGEKIFGSMTDAQVEALPDQQRPFARSHHESKKASDALRRALSDDLCIYAELRRNTECHLRQSAFLLQVNGKIQGVQSLKTESSLKCLGRKATVAELQTAVRHVLGAHANEDRRIARGVARRITEPVEQLLAARKLLE